MSIFYYTYIIYFHTQIDLELQSEKRNKETVRYFIFLIFSKKTFQVSNVLEKLHPFNSKSSM